MNKTNIKYGEVEINTLTGEVKYPKLLNKNWELAQQKAMEKAKTFQKAYPNKENLYYFAMGLHYVYAEWKGQVSFLI